MFYKLNFNAGDKFYFSSALEQQSIIDYRDTFENFEAFLLQLCQENEIDALVCFGDTRPIIKLLKEYQNNCNVHFGHLKKAIFASLCYPRKEDVNAFS